mmetsp:Transcript_7488/g.16992  ORF Transcript_7488/g.16992 Transcript_7488/m.16992 type:complete len:240 (+) Transcript_7488:83-802(+)
MPMIYVARFSSSWLPLDPSLQRAGLAALISRMILPAPPLDPSLQRAGLAALISRMISPVLDPVIIMTIKSPATGAETTSTTALIGAVTQSTEKSTGTETTLTTAAPTAVTESMTTMATESKKGAAPRSVRDSVTPTVPGETLTVISVVNKTNASGNTNSPGAGMIRALILTNLVVETEIIPEAVKQRESRIVISMVRTVTTTASALGRNLTRVAREGTMTAPLGARGVTDTVVVLGSVA